MTNSVNDAAAPEVTVTESKAAPSMTREQFEKIAADSSEWKIVRHEKTGEYNDVTYCEMSIHNGSLGIKVSGIQFASDGDGDVEDGFTSEHKIIDAGVFDTKARKRVMFPLDFGDECDDDWFFDLIDDVVDDKINEVVGEYAASYDESGWTASLVSRKACFRGSDVSFYDFVIEVEEVVGNRKYIVTGRRLATGGSWGESVVCYPDVFSDGYCAGNVPRSLADVLIEAAEECMEENLQRDYDDDRDEDEDEDEDNDGRY